MSRQRTSPILIIAAGLLLIMGMGAGVAAQGTPAAEGSTEDSTPRPAHIHFGTCDELGDVAFPLEDVADVIIAGSPVPSPVIENTDDPEIVQGERVIESVTEVEANWDTLLGENATYAINVHESAENIGVYIACGDITGEPQDDRLEIELSELNGSGWQGGAVLQQTGDNTITVTVTLRDMGDLQATPAS